MPLRAVSSSDTPEPVGTHTPYSKLSRDDLSYFSQSLNAARGQFTYATKSVCTEFGLGPRGPWIIGLIGKSPLAPHALADIFNVGRSLITAELGKLVEAGLIEQRKDADDGRRFTLFLTDAGRKVYERLGEALDAFISERLSGYSRDEIMMCGRLLNDFAKVRDWS